MIFNKGAMQRLVCKHLFSVQVHRSVCKHIHDSQNLLCFHRQNLNEGEAVSEGCLESKEGGRGLESKKGKSHWCRHTPSLVKIA